MCSAQFRLDSKIYYGLDNKPRIKEELLSPWLEKGNCYIWTGAIKRSAKELADGATPYGYMRVPQEWIASSWDIPENYRGSKGPHILSYWKHKHVGAFDFNEVESKRNDIAHLCGNSLCCNPDHLEMMSRSENLKAKNIQIKAMNQWYLNRIKTLENELLEKDAIIDKIRSHL